MKHDDNKRSNVGNNYFIKYFYQKYALRAQSAPVLNRTNSVLIGFSDRKIDEKGILKDLGALNPKP